MAGGTVFSLSSSPDVASLKGGYRSEPLSCFLFLWHEGSKHEMSYLKPACHVLFQIETKQLMSVDVKHCRHVKHSFCFPRSTDFREALH